MIEDEEQSTQSVGERMHIGQAIHSTQMLTSSQVLLCTYSCVYYFSDLQM